MKLARRTSRVRGLPESFGELPAVCLSEEIATPGDGQIRALITVAGNPVLSIPNGAALDDALAGLDFMVSFDVYVNETTRHADVILPSASALAKSHYDLALLQLAIRNVANYSPPVLPLGPDELDDWVILCKLALVAQGLGADADPALADDLAIRSLVDSAVADEHSPVHGRDPEEILDTLAPRVGPERILDFMARTGPYGDGFGAPGRDGGLTLDVLLEHPHGIDFGALEPRLPEVLRTPSGKVELAPDALVADVPRFARVARARARRVRPRGPSRPPIEQLLDAQRERAREGQAALHAADPPRRRRTTRPRRRRRREGRVAHGRGGRAGRGDRWHPARRREHPARVGTLARRHRDGGRRARTRV